MLACLALLLLVACGDWTAGSPDADGAVFLNLTPVSRYHINDVNVVTADYNAAKGEYDAKKAAYDFQKASFESYPQRQSQYEQDLAQYEQDKAAYDDALKKLENE